MLGVADKTKKQKISGWLISLSIASSVVNKPMVVVVFVAGY